MNLKKWAFDFDIYDNEYVIVFAENLEEALDIVNHELWEYEEFFETLDGYDIEELEIKNPEKAYKGCYIKEDNPWYDF